MAEDFWWKRAGFFYGLARQSEFVRTVHRAFLKEVEALYSAPIRALDAGCGDGNASLPMARMGHAVIGIDFGHSVLNRARIRAKRQNISNIQFEYADLNHPLPYADASFELVTSLHAIMKVQHFDIALREFYRVTKPGGKLVLSTTTSEESFLPWLKRYARENGWLNALWDTRWIIAWGIPYCLLTRKSERRNEWRWPKNHCKNIVETIGYRTLSIEDVPYTHVGCVLGVFEKPL